MSVMILRLVYGLYILGGVFIVLHTLSAVIFTKQKVNWRSAGIRFLVSFIWPLCFFSKAGRQTLFQPVRR